MPVAWVLGRSGLIGSALSRALSEHAVPEYVPADPIAWSSDSAFETSLRSAVADFGARAEASDSWELYWAAGVGNMGSSAELMARETAMIQRLVRLIADDPRLRTRPGTAVFASSAGAVYAGCTADVVSESTPPRPTTPYAEAKLEQEAAFLELGRACEGLRVVLARISTVYGPGQAVGKPQGLLAHMARSIVRNRPVQIFVPFDTIRDYVYVDDAARQMVAAARRATSGLEGAVRIIAAQTPTSIAEIVSVYKRISRRAPRVVTSANRLTGLYRRRIQFRSELPPLPGLPPRTSLLVGVGRLLSAERQAFAAHPLVYRS